VADRTTHRCATDRAGNCAGAGDELIDRFVESMA